MTGARDKELEELRRWLLRRIWPGRYGRLEAAFENFRRVLQDFHNTFHKHVTRTEDGEWLFTEKFYHIDEWDEARYARLAKQFDYHVDLVEDLFLELTRAANLVCDEVRAAILPAFRRDQGRLTAEWGPIAPLGSFIEAVVQYSPEEKALDRPYPGLEEFKTIRESRDRSFGQGAAP